jgi:hypothetical protein
MNELMNMNSEQKNSSVYLVEQINLFRKEEGKSDLRHSDFITKIELEFEEEIGERNISLTSYLDKSNRQSKCYDLNFEQSLQLLMSESKTVRKQVVQVLKSQHEQINKIQVPTTFKEALLLAVEQQEKIEQLELETKTLEIELDKSHEWISIKKVAHANSVHWKSLEWKKLKDVSKITGYLPKKIFDANFPAGVNAYHVSAWKIVYPNLKY